MKLWPAEGYATDFGCEWWQHRSLCFGAFRTFVLLSTSLDWWVVASQKNCYFLHWFPCSLGFQTCAWILAGFPDGARISQNSTIRCCLRTVSTKIGLHVAVSKCKKYQTDTHAEASNKIQCFEHFSCKMDEKCLLSQTTKQRKENLISGNKFWTDLESERLQAKPE